MSDFPKLPRIKQDDENMEKLHCAARRGQTDLVRRLVASGIDPSIPNKFGCTALHLACKYGQIGAVKELAPRADLSGLWHGQRPLHLAVRQGYTDIVTALIEAAKTEGRDIAALVNESDEYELFDFLGQAKHIQGQTPLHWAVGLRNIPMIKTLLSLGASPTAKDKAGETPLMRCVEFNMPEEFDLLLSLPNVRIEVGDRAGRTPLHWALLKNRPEMSKKLFALGHDVNMEDQDKNTPVLLAAQAAMPSLLDSMLNNLDPFALQQMTFHNGVTVLPERITWLPFATDENLKAEVVKVLQKRLDSVAKNSSQSTTRPGLGNTGVVKPMTVAPSAPVKK